MTGKQQRLLNKEVTTVLVRRMAIALAVSSLLALGTNAVWSIYQNRTLERHISDALAASLNEAIQSKDLISIKRILRAFELANPESKICVRLDDGIELSNSVCQENDFQIFTTRLTGQTFLVAVHLPFVATPAFIGIVLFFMSSFGLLYAQSSARKLTTDLLLDLSDLPVSKSTRKMNFKELADAKEKIERTKMLEEENHQTKLEVETQHAIILLGAQVAHDMRSPLTALNILSKFCDNLPADQLSLLKASVERLRKISSDLLVQSKRSIKPLANSPTSERVKLGQVLKEIVDEKRFEHSETRNVVLTDTINIPDYHLLFESEVSSLKRSISNIVNNAYEAIQGQGVIALSAIERRDAVEIAVTDNGKGIPPEVLQTIATLGATAGKQGGTGLGLYSAKKIVQSMGGALTIESRIGEGTSVKLMIPTKKLMAVV